MTIGSEKAGASQNLVQTYQRLGLATQGAAWSREHGFDLCLGEFEHPICNFAANLDLDPWSARRLAAIAQNQTCFNVYVSAGDRPEYLEELLFRAGFSLAYRLAQLVAEPTESECFNTLNECAETERALVARFMVDQFFSQRSTQLKSAIADATARAKNVDLHYASDRSRYVAAVMLSEAGGMLGIYNLCVASSSRGRGIGSSVVHWAIDQARQRHMLATVQCEPHLEGWYHSLGFRRTGWLNVYRLSKGPTSDIIELI